MLDVHPAHHAANSWRDFFVHIATIVIGLFIAVGLEQTVEAIHRHQERAELRDAMRREMEEDLKDCADTEDRKLYHVGWLDRRIAQVKAAVWEHQSLPPTEPFRYPRGNYDFPNGPLWRSAKTSGLVTLLSADEINAYSEVELGADLVQTSHEGEKATWRELQSFEGQMPASPDGRIDWSRATVADLRAYLALLNDDRQEVQRFRRWNLQTMGDVESIQRGDLNLHDMFASEAATADAAKL